MITPIKLAIPCVNLRFSYPRTDMRRLALNLSVLAQSHVQFKILSPLKWQLVVLIGIGSTKMRFNFHFREAFLYLNSLRFSYSSLNRVIRPRKPSKLLFC